MIPFEANVVYFGELRTLLQKVRDAVEKRLGSIWSDKECVKHCELSQEAYCISH